MIPNSEQIQSLLVTLKGKLKSFGLTYKDVAIHLGLSEASVKRMFSKGHFSISRLIDTCQLVELSLHDLFKLTELKQKDVDRLPVDTELAIVKDNYLMLVAVCVFSYWKFEEILRFYQISEAELVKNLLRLEKMNIITLKPNNQYQLHISPHFSWIPNGPIEHFFKLKIQDEFLEHNFYDSGCHRRLLYGMLSEDSNQQFQKALEKLEITFKQLCEQDKFLPMDEKFGTVHLMALRPWELASFSELKKEVN